MICNPPMLSTKSALEPYTVRFVRTCSDDDSENLGVYLLLDVHEMTDDGRSLWRYLVLVEDSDDVGDVQGSTNAMPEDWLVEYTEPYPA